MLLFPVPLLARGNGLSHGRDPAGMDGRIGQPVRLPGPEDIKIAVPIGTTLTQLGLTVDRSILFF